MATLWIREYDAQGYPGRETVPIANESSNTRTGAVPVGAGSLQSDPFLPGTRVVGIQADLTCWIDFGFNPTAVSGQGERIGKDQPPRYFGVYGRDMLAVILE